MIKQIVLQNLLQNYNNEDVLILINNIIEISISTIIIEISISTITLVNVYYK